MTMYINIRWKQRFENFTKAYFSLLKSIEALDNDKDNEFIQDSVIQRYEYTIELAWKTLKDYLEELGFLNITSPKNVVRKAFQERIIKNPNFWLQALDDRNKTSHIYEKAIAKEIITEINKIYINLFTDLYNYLIGFLNE